MVRRCVTGSAPDQDLVVGIWAEPGSGSGSGFGFNHRAPVRRISRRTRGVQSPAMPIRLDIIDLRYLDLDGAAAAFVLHGEEGAGVVLVECGAMATLPRLESELRVLGVEPDAVTDLFVTHIHLDHAGAAGAFAARGARVHVHPFGARHLVAPERLVASSRRVHGDAFDRHYGAPLPCPAELVDAVDDGATRRIGSASFRAIETPGHARHHHAWLVEINGSTVLFAGDAAAMRVPGSSFVSVPMPPPEFDPASWRGSITRMREAAPDLLMLTHFGAVESPTAHLDTVSQRLEEELSWIVAALEQHGDDDAALLRSYNDWLGARARAAGVDDRRLRAFLGAPYQRMNLAGVRRWLTTGRP